MIKLTPPQLELLHESQTCCTCVRSYKPAIRLVEIGFCTWSDGSFGGSYLNITKAGEAYLASLEKGKP